MGNIAKISGVALAPGVSRNRRLYTPELIAKAAKRMQERIADPNGLPIVMRTHHDAGDDSAKIVGRVTEVTIDDNKALRYKAQLYDTFHAREIANLVTPAEPALRSVSIHGYWMGDTRQISYEGGMATTADDLEIDAIDFTATPGVDGALIDSSGKTTESGGVVRTAISESIEANVTLVEEGSVWVSSRGRQHELDLITEAKYSADDMKDLLSKGQAMKNASGEPSYPIADISDLKKAIKAVGRGKSGHDAIRAHIMKRAKALGATDLIPDNWGAGGKMKESVPVRMSEITEYYPDGPSNPSGFCIDAYSGPLSVTVRGCVPPDQLRAAAQMAVCAAMDAISCMDPDTDADIDAGVEVAGDMDNMDGLSGESSKGSGEVLTEDAVRGLIAQYLEDHDRQVAKEAVADLRQKNEGVTLNQVRAEAAAEMTMAPDGDGHSHTHAMDGEAHSHAHKHDHVDESGGDGYSHSHTHGHVHASSDGESHDHGHNHIHMTSPSATSESTETTDKESAVSETTKAAEAAPTSAFTDEDKKFLAETIGNTVADAMRAVAEMNTPKHAAATQETTETVEQEVATESVTKVDTDLTALKESLAKELRTELRNELRAEFLEEKGLPPRRGYRLTENDEPQEMSNAELFDKYRAEILLGSYAPTPVPGAQAS